MPKILAIDDKSDNLITISTLLKHLIPESEVVTAQSGIEGIEAVVDESPDVILLDLRMPGIDEFEVCKRLKSEDNTRNIPVIMLTAVKTDSKSRVKGLELGADAFLTKPINETELAAQVNVALRMKRAEDALRAQRDILENAVSKRTKELTESEQRVRLALEGTDQGLWDWDVANGRFAFDNYWPGVLGYRVNEIEFNFHWWESNIHPDSKPVYEKALQNYLDGKVKYYELEYQFRRKSGKWMWIWARGICVNYDTDGNTLRFIGTHRDITNRKKAEEDLRKAYDELEIKVAERTKELCESNQKLKLEMEEREKAQKALRDQQAQLVHAGRLASLGEMSTGVAHELNQPLSIIRLYAESFLIGQDKLNKSEINENATSIIRLVDRAADIVNHMRRFASAKSIYMQDIDPVASMDSALDFFKEQFRSHGIEIQTEYGDNLPKIHADEQLLEQAMINFLSNARYAVETRDKNETGNYRKSVTLRLWHDHANHDVIIEVADNGIGMTLEEKEKCFDPFYTTKDVGQRTGIGLSIANDIIRELEGRLDFDSERNVGTAMRLIIPCSHRDQTH